ncbi:SHOCT domain-containing protein [Streptomyces viridifaciens]|uniref:SHOCT domain-containing protein n=1 Tax=Kitasatospora aureofaciens TaxID=1894 RepID=UPI0009259F0D|nr:SHOCT domain-containing protein [Streptomyces viridifaciens]
MRHWHGHGFGPGYGGPGGWGIAVMAIVTLIVLVVLVLLAVALFRYVFRSRQPIAHGPGAVGVGPGAPHGWAHGPTPEQLLAERFARGEIDAEEYRHRRETLRSPDGPSGTSGPGEAGGPDGPSGVGGPSAG